MNIPAVVKPLTGSRIPSCPTTLKAVDAPCSPEMPVISEERKQQMIAYAKKLKQKYPHMKPERIGKKVAKEFKIKLV